MTWQDGYRNSNTVHPLQTLYTWKGATRGTRLYGRLDLEEVPSTTKGKETKNRLDARLPWSQKDAGTRQAVLEDQRELNAIC